MGEDRKSSWRAGRGQEALQEGQEESGGTSREPGGVGRTGRVGRPYRKGREELGGPPGESGGGGRPIQRAGRVEREGRVREALWEGCEWSKGLSGRLQGFGRDGRGREALPEGQEALGGPSGGLRGVKRPSQEVRRGWEALRESPRGVGRHS